MTDEGKDLEEPKATATVDPFHPTKVKGTTTASGVVAAIFLLIGIFMDNWSSLTTPPIDIAPGVTSRSIGMIIVGFGSVLTVWLAVEIALSHRRWAALVLFLLALMGLVLNLLAMFGSGHRTSTSEIVLAAGTVFIAFYGVRGSRQIAAGKFVDPVEGSDPVPVATLGILGSTDGADFKGRFAAAWSAQKPLRRMIYAAGAASILFTLFYSWHIWDKAASLPAEPPPIAPAVGEEPSPTPAAQPPATQPEPIAPSDIPKLYPAAYRQWRQSMVELGLEEESWATEFDGPAAPLRPLVFEGQRYVFGSACQVHNCADARVFIMFSDDQSNVLGIVHAVPEGGQLPQDTPVGSPSQSELNCMVKLADEGQSACE